MIQLKDITLVIWDWNGTLLDDVAVCVDSINMLLNERQLTPLDKTLYQQIFTFPVKDYYEKAGFNFGEEPFEIPAMQFMDLYRTNLNQAALHQETISVLKQLQSLGLKQAILSAMEQELLVDLLQRYQIADYFDQTFGIDNHFGAGKIERGKELIHSMKLNPNECLLIGDTLHDAEVAKSIGCRCLLFDGGHQSRIRLETSGHAVLSNLNELFAL
ncbi:MAG: HAD family hydrolase [Bacteroidales bacterium]|nr:HAD family hydrolase [Bacteroidales bacterium]